MSKDRQRTKGDFKKQAATLAKSSAVKISEEFASWVELPPEFGNRKRNRLFSPSRTFWLFLFQVLGEDSSCREALRQFLAWLFVEEGKTASPNTAAYCKARKKLCKNQLQETNQGLVNKIENKAGDWLWCGRTVKVADGSGLSMPDTPQNQKAWPQSKKAKPSCSFPVMRIVALFCLATGVMIDLAHGALAVHERTLLRRLWHLLEQGDVLLADRGFGGFAEFFLLSQRGVDCVMRKNQRRKNASVIKRFHKNDKIVEWQKSGACPKWLDQKSWDAMPESMAVREVVVHIQNPGFRPETIFVSTTLLDHLVYPEGELSQLYQRRWKAELFLRYIKITMGMDILSCKSPEMVEKEMWMYVIAYNLIRAIMVETALTHDMDCERISFKGTVSTLRQWAPAMTLLQLEMEEREALYLKMLYYIAKDKLLQRPGRMEPRARKRRPKNYQLLNKPRGEFSEIYHRNKYKKA
jgi:hypothetical protein